MLSPRKMLTDFYLSCWNNHKEALHAGNIHEDPAVGIVWTWLLGVQGLPELQIKWKLQAHITFIDNHSLTKDQILWKKESRVSQEDVVGESFLRIQLLSSSISGCEIWWYRPGKEWKVVDRPAFLNNTDVSSPHWCSTRSSLVPWHWNNSGRGSPDLSRSSTTFSTHGHKMQIHSKVLLPQNFTNPYPTKIVWFAHFINPVPAQS